MGTSLIPGKAARNKEPQMNADNGNFLLSSGLINHSMMKINNELTRTGTNSEWLEFVSVRPSSLFITDFFIPEHRVHREKQLRSVLSVCSVVDQLCSYSFFQNKLKGLR